MKCHKTKVLIESNHVPSCLMTFATYQVDTVYALSVTLKLFSDYGFEVADTSYLQHQYL